MYRERATGKVLGKFLFALARNPEGAGRGRAGTTYYFSGNDSSQWNPLTGILRQYDENFDINNPPYPDDIEPMLSGGRRRSSKKASRKSKKASRKSKKGSRKH